MKKFDLSEAHKQKRSEKKRFVLRDDIFCTYLQREMGVKDYFDLSFSFPDEVDKILMDAMYAGDWYSVYESKLLPLRREPMLARFRSAGVDIFAEWITHVHGRGKECWLADRISEVAFANDINHVREMDEHPDWFIPAFGFQMLNLSVPEVREHKLRVLDEVMRKYDFDGLDIDFERHTPILPVGRQWELRECVTDFMRKLREITLRIGEEKGKVVMLSARVPDCLRGCHEDGLDVETWIGENLVDCLTLGSRSYDIKVEEFRALSDEIQIYGCYDPHHTVDGYLFPSLPVLRAVWYTHLVRGADGVEYFNWSGEGKKELIDKYVHLYGVDPKRDNFVQYANDDFTGANDRAFLEKQDKTYVIDRRGGYPWGIGYGNLNADRQLPAKIKGEGEVKLFVAENAGLAKKATLRLLFEELSEIPEVDFNGRKLSVTASPHRDLQVTTEAEAPVSGYTVSTRLANGTDLSKPCTMLTADLTGMETEIGYNTVRVVSAAEVSLEKVELDVFR